MQGNPKSIMYIYRNTTWTHLCEEILRDYSGDSCIGVPLFILVGSFPSTLVWPPYPKARIPPPWSVRPERHPCYLRWAGCRSEGGGVSVRRVSPDITPLSRHE